MLGNKKMRDMVLLNFRDSGLIGVKEVVEVRQKNLSCADCLF